ncbi:hypothetical protein INT47_012412, partial [Mucor saturninus]
CACRIGAKTFLEEFLSSNGNNKHVAGRAMDISTPYNTVHVTHVGFDPNTGEFTGLPKQWLTLLTQSGITKQEQENNPQAVIHAIEFFQGSTREEEVVWNKIPQVTLDKSDTSKSLERFPTLRITKSTRGESESVSEKSNTTQIVVEHKQLEDEFMDDVRSINTESTASLGQELEQKQDTPENSVTSSLSSAPPGTVKQRPPKEKSMNDQDVILKLQELCANADPLLIYSNMEKIGQG